MFLGEYYRTIDNKGRIFIPSKFREDLIKGIVVSRAYDEKCLFLYSKENWNKLEDNIRSNKVAERNIQRFSRWFFSSASEEAMDQQGRIKIPGKSLDVSFSNLVGPYFIFQFIPIFF